MVCRKAGKIKIKDAFRGMKDAICLIHICAKVAAKKRCTRSEILLW